VNVETESLKGTLSPLELAPLFCTLETGRTLLPPSGHTVNHMNFRI
jgi:hypothetical protein